MKNAIKDKITVSIEPGLLQAIDLEIRSHHANSRSSVIEKAIRFWQLEQRRRAIEQQTEAYYRSRSKTEQKEDREWGRIAARQIKYLWND